MNWNKYTHIYELENTDKKYICLYNSLNMEVSYMRKDTFENINNLLAEAKCENYTENNENLNKLKGAGFIDSNNDNTSLNNCDHNLNAQPLTLTLLLTNACNLDCSYCQMNNNTFWRALDMKEDTSLYTAYKIKTIFSDLPVEYNNDDLKNKFKEVSKSTVWDFIQKSDIVTYYYSDYRNVVELLEFIETVKKAFDMAWPLTISNKYS